MRKIILAATLAATAGSWTLAQGPPRDRPAAAPVGTATISGRVTIRGTKPVAPVRRARITLHSSVLGQPQTIDADAEGRFRFERLPAGEYRLSAEKAGFVPMEHGASRPSQRPGPIAVKDGDAITADVALPRGAALEGRIVNEDGEPVQNVIVSAVRFTYGPAGRRPTAVKQARTDDLGRYRIHSLLPGDYYVDVAPDPLQSAAGLVLPGSRPPGLARTYFPGTARVHEARRVALTIGQNAADLNFAMASVPLASVTIQVLDSSGKPVPRSGLRIQRVGAAPGEVSGFADQKPGVFIFRTVPPGDYWVMAAHAPQDGVREFAVSKLTVAGEDVSDFTITTSRGAVVEGRVEVEGDGPLPGSLTIVGHETEFELPNPRPGAPPEMLGIGADGRFQITGLFGPRIMRVGGLPGSWALKSVWFGDAEIADVVTDFKGANAPLQMRIVVTNRTGAISGTVTDARNQPVAAARVVAFPADERLWGPTSRHVKTVSSNQGGDAKIEGLLPGRYFIAAIDALDEGAWHDPDVLRRLRFAAVAVDVAEKETRTVTLKLRAQS